MQEIEFKFQVPIKKQKALKKAFTSAKAESVHLAAQYFDTAEETLVQHGMVVRRRQENGTWKQTLKMFNTAKLGSRFELEFDITPPETDSLNLNHYKNYPVVYKKLKHAVGVGLPPLELLFETSIQRLHLLRHVESSTVEIVLDVGQIFNTHRHVNLFEIEFELKQGNLEHLIAFIRPWIETYQLILDTHSKSDIGFQIVRQQGSFPARHQRPFVLNIRSNQSKALQSMVTHCLQHLLPNVSSIARQQYTSEHVHQARVAIRRLRTVLKIFAPWSTQIQPHWKNELAKIFQALGGTRDMDALNENLLPQLIEAGYGLDHLPTSTERLTDICTLLQQTETTQLWLELIVFTEQKQDSPSKRSLQKHALKTIQTLHDKICAQAKHFGQLEDEDKHRVRKQVKQLRYSIEFLAPLLTTSSLKPYLKKLKAVQESLGQYNDLAVAEILFQHAPQSEHAYIFATGWIAAEKNRILTLVQQQLIYFSQTQKIK